VMSSDKTAQLLAVRVRGYVIGITTGTVRVVSDVPYFVKAVVRRMDNANKLVILEQLGFYMGGAVRNAGNCFLIDEMSPMLE
jgi:hypothetical protein